MVFIFECIKNFFASWAIPIKVLLSYVVIWSLLSTKQDDSTPINMTIAMLAVDLILSYAWILWFDFYGYYDCKKYCSGDYRLFTAFKSSVDL